jgi:hypothetical protein
MLSDLQLNKKVDNCQLFLGRNISSVKCLCRNFLKVFLKVSFMDLDGFANGELNFKSRLKTHISWSDSRCGQMLFCNKHAFIPAV